MRLATLFAATAILAVAAAAAPAKKLVAAETNYWMSAETVTGLATGEPGGEARKLQLQLGSARRPAGAPSAAHLPPATLGAGPSLPLTSPRSAVAGAAQGPRGAFDPASVKGRMILYWGCGEKARAGQPLVVDLAGMATGKGSGLAGGLTAAMMRPPAPGQQASYGEWPGAGGGAVIPARGSLVGEHVVRGNYSPELRYAVSADSDFLAPLKPRSTLLPSGAVKLSWAAVPRARGTVAAVMGAADDGTIVMWTSSEVRMAGMMFPDYLGQEESARLLAAGALLSPSTGECTVPAEVVKAGGMTLQMTAYGPETNIRAPSGEAWTMKLRTRSAHMGMLKPELVEAAAIRPAASGPQHEPKAKRRGSFAASALPLVPRSRFADEAEREGPSHFSLMAPRYRGTRSGV